MPLVSPDIASPSPLLADWVELQALASDPRRASRSTIDSIFRLTAEERPIRLRRDSVTAERDDGEILEAESELVVSDVLRELRWRQDILGAAYPFELRMAPGGRVNNWELIGPDDPINDAHYAYLACLLIVAFRRNMLEPANDISSIFTNHSIGKVFQICACLAVAGYIQGSVVSFGWPRAEGNNFLPALRSAWEKIGSYKIVDKEPPGAPTKLKDGGIDVIGWKNFPDKRPARIIIFGQAASGDNWIDKTAREPATTLTGTWFVGHGPGAWLPATIMPFLAHEETDDDGDAAVSGRMHYHEHTHGIIFDRVRVASSFSDALGFTQDLQREIDGFDQLGELRKWIGAVLASENSGDTSV